MARTIKKISRALGNLNISKTFFLVMSVAPRLTILTIILVILESAFWFGTLYTTKKLISVVGSQYLLNKESLLNNCLSEALVIGILFTIVRFTANLVAEYQATKVSEYIDDKIHEKAVQLDLLFYESPGYYDILKRAKDAGPEKPTSIILGMIGLLKSVLLFFVISSMLISIHWGLLPLLILFIIPILLIRINQAKQLQELRLAQTPIERKASYYSYLITGDSSAKEIRLYRLGNHLRKIYLDLRLSLLKDKMAVKRKLSVYELLATIVSVSGIMICLWIIVHQSLTGKSDVGDLAIFIVVFIQSFSLIQSIATNISSLFHNSIILKSIFDLFELKNAAPTKMNENDFNPDEQILVQTKDLCFTYPSSAKSCLNSINIELHPGKVIALVGLNGSGKSTLAKLLCGLYQPASGNIYFQGKNILNFTQEEYSKKISTVFQDFVKYNVSISDNIRYGNIELMNSKDNIIAAAKKSGADEMINNMSEGYETLMGKIFEEGHEISIGQWQKLAIARAFYSDSKVLLLDEATSALDVLAESSLFEHLKKNLEGRTALVISHRLSTVKQADCIYVLSEGSIVQSGKHEELIEMEGEYKKMFTN